MARSILPNPPLPRSSRVRSRWDRMRTKPALQKTFRFNRDDLNRDPRSGQGVLSDWKFSCMLFYGDGELIVREGLRSFFFVEYHATFTPSRKK